MYIYTVNEVNILWRTAQHAAFDAANSSLLSATSQLLCLKAVEDLERCMPWPGLCGSSNVSILPMGCVGIWPCIYNGDDVNPLGGLHSMLLSTQQILVCFLLLPNQLCQKAV